MNETDFLDHFINKSVDFRSHRRQLQFHLSQSLFSSHDIDVGTRLLLKTIGKQVDIEQVSSLLDIGCGVGILGICLKKLRPEMDVTFQDRDALALSFTELNARTNQIGEVGIQGNLALDGLGQKRFDLIVSNLPGKAGPPVLRETLGRIPAYLTEQGQAAIVIVKPLEELVEQTLLENGSELLFREGRKGYTVFHFRGGGVSKDPETSLTPYVRGNYPFKAAKSSFKLKTAYNIPEFDTLGYQTTLAMNAIKNKPIKGKALFWNPGQGYLPVFFSKRSEDTVSEYVIASRDLLSIHITKMNLVDNGVASEIVTGAHLPHILCMEGEFDFIILFPDIDPGVPWDRVLFAKCSELLAPGGSLLLTAKSSFVHRLLAKKKGFTLKTNKKRHGFRSLLLERRQ